MKSMQTADFTITTYPDKVLKLTYYIFLLFLHSEALLIFEKKKIQMYLAFEGNLHTLQFFEF